MLAADLSLTNRLEEGMASGDFGELYRMVEVGGPHALRGVQDPPSQRGQHRHERAEHSNGVASKEPVLRTRCPQRGQKQCSEYRHVQGIADQAGLEVRSLEYLGPRVWGTSSRACALAELRSA